MKEFFEIGGISGLESFVRNLAYMVMISRMVNVVGEQGTYWVANNFIWGWLLLPVIQLGELIKEETAENIENVKKNALAGNFVIDKDKFGKFYYKLRNAHKSIICIGESYKTADSCISALESVRKLAAKSQIAEEIGE